MAVSLHLSLSLWVKVIVGKITENEQAVYNTKEDNSCMALLKQLKILILLTLKLCLNISIIVCDKMESTPEEDCCCILKIMDVSRKDTFMIELWA